MNLKQTVLSGLAAVWGMTILNGSGLAGVDPNRTLRSLTCQDNLSDTKLKIALIEAADYGDFPQWTVPQDTPGQFAWGTLVMDSVTERFAGRFLVELEPDGNRVFYFVGGQGRGEDLIKFKAVDWSKIYGGADWKKVSDRSVLDGFCEPGY